MGRKTKTRSRLRVRFGLTIAGLLLMAGCANGTLSNPDARSGEGNGADAVSGDASPGRADTCSGAACRTNESCVNGIQDGSETDIDCGDPDCAACTVGEQCRTDDDCKSGSCDGGTCRAPGSCTDGMKNGAETDVDCGGSSCGACAVGKQCNSNGDCQSGRCDGGTCQAKATCSDGTKNGSETDIDCGGPNCTPCKNGNSCSGDTDCQSGRCDGGTCKTQASCADGVRNNSETDVDCGGPNCTPCVDGRKCNSGTDCRSDRCDGGICKPEPTCSDGTRNGDETDVDCGGRDCAGCGSGDRCSADSDCQSNLECSADTCQLPSDQPPGASCSKNSQCQSDICTGGQCAHVLFTTSKSYEGDVGIINADQECQSLYGTGKWKAILSASVHAKSRISVKAPVYNTNGDKLADSASDLWDGQLHDAPNYDESGSYEGGAVWTGTDGQGESTRQTNNGVCVDWAYSGTSYTGTIGYASSTGADWVESEERLC